ncbi:ABC transporter family protein, partial [Vibrio parahaemolyticus V-223/04]
QENRP